MPGSGWTGVPCTGQCPRQAAFVVQEPLLHVQPSGVVAQGSAAAHHAVARDENGDLEDSEAATISLASGQGGPWGSRARTLSTRIQDLPRRDSFVLELSQCQSPGPQDSTGAGPGQTRTQPRRE